MAAFQALGHHVEGVEPCEQLAAAAREVSRGARVHTLDFQTIAGLPSGTGAKGMPSFLGTFHGVFCLASLLHVPRSELVLVLRGLASVLLQGGLLLATLPLAASSHEETDALGADGRWRNCMPATMFLAMLQHAGLEVIIKRSFRIYNGRSTLVICRHQRQEGIDIYQNPVDRAVMEKLRLQGALNTQRSAPSMCSSRVGDGLGPGGSHLGQGAHRHGGTADAQRQVSRIPSRAALDALSDFVRRHGQDSAASKPGRSPRSTSLQRSSPKTSPRRDVGGPSPTGSPRKDTAKAAADDYADESFDSDSSGGGAAAGAGGAGAPRAKSRSRSPSVDSYSDESFASEDSAAASPSPR